jgi:hypothetical protein
MIHLLVFFYEDNAGEAFKLEKNNTNYTLKFSGATKKHTCTGAPCNSCKMSTTWLTTVKCTCNQTNCDTCKCNHTVIKTIKKTKNLQKRPQYSIVEIIKTQTFQSLPTIQPLLEYQPFHINKKGANN